MILPKAGDWMSISYKMMWLLVHDLDYGFGKIPPVGGMAIRSTIRYPHIASLCTELNERGGIRVSPLESGLHSPLGPRWPSVFPLERLAHMYLKHGQGRLVPFYAIA